MVTHKNQLAHVKSAITHQYGVPIVFIVLTDFLIFVKQAMASELNMYESQVNEYKYEIERIARELQEVKKKYFMQKKKETQQK